MFIVGLTGGIGSGKTAVSDRFKALGINIVDADMASRVVVEPGRPALARIADHFGQDILLADQSLDRAALRQRIFASQAEKHWLEQLLHPLINQQITAELAAATSPYAIFVSPLLLETSQHSHCDRLLVVDVPEDLQIERTIRRDNNDEQQVRRIIASQSSRQQRLAKADDVIENTAGLTELHLQVDTLHQHYLQLAQTHTTGEITQ